MRTILAANRIQASVCLLALLAAVVASPLSAAADDEQAKGPAADIGDKVTDDKAEKDSKGKPAAKEGTLAKEQEQVADRFKELKKLLLRMSELTAPTDPGRAAPLRRAVAQSNQRAIDEQFEKLVKLLGAERLEDVIKNQGEVQQDLAKLLELLLSEDRSKKIESEKERIRDYLKRVNKIIKEQKGVQGETGRGGDAKKLAGQQGDLSKKTGDLAKDLDEDNPKANPEAGKDAKSPEDKDAEEKDPKDQEGKSQDGKNSDGKSGEPSSGKDQPGEPGKDGKKQQGKDSKEKDGSDKDAKDKDAKDKADKDKDGEKKDGDKKDGDAKKGDKKDAENKDGDSKKGDSKDSEKGDSPDSQPGDKNQSPQEGQPGQPGQQGEQQQQQQQQEQNPTQKRIEQAQQRMQEAQKKLDEAKRNDAIEKQEEAIKELEQAKAELEEILRQLREEQMARMLAMLEARFRKMLDMQVEVYEGTKRLDKVPAAERDRDDEIEASRLSRKEAQISTEAEKALNVLREEGSAVAFPEAIVDMRDDMDQVKERLSQSKVGEVTQGIEKDIIAALEEMIAVLEKAQKDLEQKQQQQQQQQPTDGNGEPPLVDVLAELKMIRALQMRVNQRTQRYAAMSPAEQTDRPELIEALKRLADREQRIHKVTRDIVVGRNK